VALPTRASQRRAITASASKLTKRDKDASKSSNAQHWQQNALLHYDQIGELRFASHFIARMMSRVRFYPALLGDDGKLTEITEGPPVERLNRIQDPGGGRSQLQYRYGLLQFVTGEGILFGYRLEQPDERWKFLWKDEVEFNDDGSAVRLDAQHKKTNDVGVAYRLWTPHPRHSDEPDAPVRAVLDICEELLLLTASVASTATSRMTNGILALPTEASPNAFEVGRDEDPEVNIFLKGLYEHISSQIENPTSADAKAPFVLEAAYDWIDRVRWIQTHDPQNDYLERELRKEAVHRLALGLDMPPEMLEGIGQVNHWGGKAIQMDAWRTHGINKAEQLADDLSEEYLRRGLEEDEYEDWNRVVVGVDDSQVVISPDRTEDADKALDRIAISFAGYRELKGIREDMAPSDEEREFLASLKIRQPVEIENGDLIIPQRGPVAAQNGSSPEEGPATPSGPREVSRQEARTASARILGAAELALMRCRELAGIRIRHKCKSCAEGSPDSLVASVLGQAEVQDPMKLVNGGADGLRSLLSEWGFEDTQAGALCQMVEVFAARTLFESKQPDLPSGFMAQVEKAKEVSDALVHPAA
jgi:hypothetical protein